MSRLIGCALFGACVLAVGCGDDGAAGDRDSGPIDAAAAADGGEDAATTGTTMSLRFVDPEAEPLADVKFVVDSEAGRVEGLSDAEGLLELTVPAEVGDPITWTAALESYVIVSALDVPHGEGGTGGEPFEITLSPLSGAGGDRTPFAINATGVPAGGRICASHGNPEGTNWSLCNGGGSSWSYMIPLTAIGEAVNAWAIDADGTPVDFARITIPDGETAVTVDFDGSFETDPETRVVRVLLPDDPDDPLQTATFTELVAHWFNVTAGGPQWSVATNPRRDGSDLLVDVAMVEPPAGSDLRYAVQINPDISGVDASSFAVYPSDPGTEAQAMGLPTVVSGDRLDGSFAIDPPEPVGDDALRHALQFINSGRRVFWQVFTERTSDIVLPELPSAYDRSVSLPFEGASGTLVVRSFTRLEEGEEAGVDRAFHVSSSEAHTVTF